MDLHPALLDFGQPWNYVAALHTQSTGGGGSITGPTANGITLVVNGNADAYATIQLISELTPASGKNYLVAGRFRLDTLTNIAMWLGLWETDGDPITAIIPLGFDGAFIEKNSNAVRGRRIQGGSTDSTTSDLLTISTSTFYDVAVLILGTAETQYLVRDGNGAWLQAIINTNVPQVAMRPSIAIKRTTANGNAALDVYSFFVHEWV